ncbi:porin family protein [Zobellia galactanivorans]|uniref:porin family protein n=1 Tax=Zobellia galactanivorans (strain DSM 12802 / CCUG 47099 / CIP 106680 / NCIMB 13871 / Dsij) TaxID=63186 RepID=UPI001C06905B|nr:porin family protein [Zobellia galactanivorans]MBU3025230.1 PorT family protein [Zobellia galactanivorans]
MKKYVFLIIGFTMTSLVSAQAWSDEFQFGVKGGVNMATVSGENFDSPDGRASFYAGVLAEAPISDRFSIQPEVFYSRQGFDIDGSAATPDAEFQIDYIQVPLMMKIYLLDGLNIQAGPQFGFKVNEELDFSPSDSENEFDSDSLRDFDLQLTSGLEYKLLESLFVQVRYTYGLSELIEDVDVHNSVFSAGIGYMF